MKLKKSAFWLTAAIVSNYVSAHYDDSYNHSSTASGDRSAWMKRLPDNKSIEKLSIPGTHDSASFYGGDIVQTQSLSISNQLYSGVRFLDIRLRHIDNVLAIHHGPVFQKQFFGDILQQVSDFLKQHPSEFVLMRVQKEHTEEGNSRSFEDTFSDYVNQYSDIIFNSRDNSYFPSVAEARGKVIFLDQIPTSGKYPPFGIKYNNFDAQDAYSVSNNWDLYGKWEKIKSHISESANGKRSRTINYLSASGGSFPYFIASGHSSSSNSAARLSTGLTTPGWSDSYPDFPRVNCFIGICTIAFEGTNILTKDWIINNKPNYTGIVVADFIGSGLIEPIINSNFR